MSIKPFLFSRRVSFHVLLIAAVLSITATAQDLTVKEIMKTEPITVPADTSTAVAIRMMREQKLACLPVTKDGKLGGIVTEHDLIVVASRLLETYLANEE